MLILAIIFHLTPLKLVSLHLQSVLEDQDSRQSRILDLYATQPLGVCHPIQRLTRPNFPTS